MQQDEKTLFDKQTVFSTVFCFFLLIIPFFAGKNRYSPNPAMIPIFLMWFPCQYLLFYQSKNLSDKLAGIRYLKGAKFAKMLFACPSLAVSAISFLWVFYTMQKLSLTQNKQFIMLFPEINVTLLTVLAVLFLYMELNGAYPKIDKKNGRMSIMTKTSRMIPWGFEILNDWTGFYDEGLIFGFETIPFSSIKNVTLKDGCVFIQGKNRTTEYQVHLLGKRSNKKMLDFFKKNKLRGNKLYKLSGK